MPSAARLARLLAPRPDHRRPVRSGPSPLHGAPLRRAVCAAVEADVALRLRHGPTSRSAEELGRGSSA